MPKIGASMKSLVKNQKKHDLTWYTVCGQREIDTLTESGSMWARPNYDPRYQLFLNIKYPGHRFYHGHWGTETLHLVDRGPYLGSLGEVYTTYDRYTEIAQWFLSELRL